MLRKTIKILALPLALFLFALSATSSTPAQSAPPTAAQQTPPTAATKSQTPAGTQSSPPTAEPQPQENERHITAYTLPPDRYKKAHDLGRIYFRFTLISFFYGLAATWLVLRWKLAAKYRS